MTCRGRRRARAVTVGAQPRRRAAAASGPTWRDVAATCIMILAARAGPRRLPVTVTITSHGLGGPSPGPPSGRHAGADSAEVGLARPRHCDCCQPECQRDEPESGWEGDSAGASTRSLKRFGGEGGGRAGGRSGDNRLGKSFFTIESHIFQPDSSKNLCIKK